MTNIPGTRLYKHLGNVIPSCPIKWEPSHSRGGSFESSNSRLLVAKNVLFSWIEALSNSLRLSISSNNSLTYLWKHWYLKLKYFLTGRLLHHCWLLTRCNREKIFREIWFDCCLCLLCTDPSCFSTPTIGPSSTPRIVLIRQTPYIHAVCM